MFSILSHLLLIVWAINWFRNNLPFISLIISTIDINAAIVTTADGGVPNLQSSLANFIAGPVPNDDNDNDNDDHCDDGDDTYTIAH
jgi:hypothetical protein